MDELRNHIKTEKEEEENNSIKIKIYNTIADKEKKRKPYTIT